MQVQEQIDSRQGKYQILSNITLINELSSYIRTTLGPYGLDKLIVTGSETTITNDGATILKKLNMKHPILKLMENISCAQDDTVGDGTTSVVLLVNAILTALKSSIEKYEINMICDCLDEILTICLSTIEKQSNALMASCQLTNQKGLICLGKTALTSKILNNNKQFFAELIIKALKSEGEINIKKIKGGAIGDSFVFSGVAFEKCFTYAGYEQQPKNIKDAKILLTNVELEWKSERENAELRITNVIEYQKVVNTEWDLIKDKLDFIVQSGAKLVFSTSAIGDYATQYFARHQIFCSGRVTETDIKMLSKICKAKIISALNFVSGQKDFLGECDLFEERQLGNTRYNFIHNENGATVILRGPGEEIINEVERSLNDALMVVKKNSNKELKLNVGGGANEIRLSLTLKKEAMFYDTEKMFVYLAVSTAFESMVGILASNFGFDSHDVVAKLIKKHDNEKSFFGVADCQECIGDMNVLEVYEPFNLKANILKVAILAVKAILMIDSTILVQNKQNH